MNLAIGILGAVVLIQQLAVLILTYFIIHNIRPRTAETAKPKPPASFYGGMPFEGRPQLKKAPTP